MLANAQVGDAPSAKAMNITSPSQPSSNPAKHERACQVFAVSSASNRPSVSSAVVQPASAIHRPTVSPACQPATPSRMASCPPIRPRPTGT